MCGICGIVGLLPVDGHVLEAMARSIMHRGPDDEGYYIAGSVGLGMRRLSIVDIVGGRQPMTNENGGIVVIFNGEIYNHPDLRDRLSARGHIFRTNSDTESIVHAYEEYGLDFVSELRGMFAIALFDRQKQSVILARDRLGKKPLYYTICNDQMIFGSEIKPILEANPSLRQVNVNAIQPFFRFGFVPEPETIYEDIYVLPSGSILEFRENRAVITQYWDLSFTHQNTSEAVDMGKRNSMDWINEVDSLIEESVRIRLMSDVPLGAFLSGGPDSSLVVAYMSKLLKEPVKTFTIAFDEEAFDESRDALRVAGRWQTQHTVKLLCPNEIQNHFFALIDNIVRHTDQPFGDPSALPTYYLAELARQEVKVVLSGDGADEVFGGYTIMQGVYFAQLYQFFPHWLRRDALLSSLMQWAALLSSPGPSRWRANAWRKRFSDSALPFYEMLVNKFSLVTSPLLEKLVPSCRYMLSGQERSERRWLAFGDAVGPFDQAQYATTKFFQVNDILVKVDRMSMAHSLEVRCPFLDHKVVEFAATIPYRLKLRGWQTKALLRDVAARYLPASNAHKKKHGFGVPISLWFRNGLYSEMRDRLNLSKAVDTYLDRPTVEHVLEQHQLGRQDFGGLIWCMLIFDAWHRLYIEGFE